MLEKACIAGWCFLDTERLGVFVWGVGDREKRVVLEGGVWQDSWYEERESFMTLMEFKWESIGKD